jgi:flagellar motor component MotA
MGNKSKGEKAMTRPINQKNIFGIIGRILIVSCLALAVILSGKFTNFMSGLGFVFVFLGGIALALISFSLEEIFAAFKYTSGRTGTEEERRKAAYFWETAVRNFWMMGVLGSVIGFVIALGNSEGGIFGIATRMTASYLSTVYGLILAVICSVPTLRISGILHSQPEEVTPDVYEKPKDARIPFLKFETLIGYALFIFVLGWMTFVPMSGQAFEGPLKPQDLFLYWPSLLLVLGGTLAIALFVGTSAAGRSFTLGFALTGFLATLIGLIQAMYGFSSRGIQEIAAAITFILSACFISLLGMMLVGNPLEDRFVKTRKGQKPLTLSRMAWLVFPLMSLILLLLTFIMVVTPIQKG